jgi:hypothetical protein
MIGPAAPQRGAALGGTVYPVDICLGAVLSGGLRRSATFRTAMVSDSDPLRWI